MSGGNHGRTEVEKLANGVGLTKAQMWVNMIAGGGYHVNAKVVCYIIPVAHCGLVRWPSTHRGSRSMTQNSSQT